MWDEGSQEAYGKVLPVAAHNTMYKETGSVARRKGKAT